MIENTMAQKRIANRRTMFILAVMFALILNGCTEKKPEAFRVGIVSGADFFIPVVDGLKDKMAQLGYVEGEHIFYELHGLNNDPDGEKKAAQKLVEAKVDLILTVPTEATLQTKSVVQGTNIPVVFAYAGLEGNNIVESVRAPGGNITGVRYPGMDQIAKRLEILRELIPSVKRVWIGYDKNYPNSIPALNVLRPLALSLGVTLVEAPVNDLAELKSELAARENATDIVLDAMILMPDSLIHSPAGWGEIKTFAAKHRVPIGGSFPYTVKSGAVFGNANDLFKVGELLAPLVDKIFRGIPAGTIPVVTPEQDLWINYTVAQELGLTVPKGLLSRADSIIR